MHAYIQHNVYTGLVFTALCMTLRPAGGKMLDQLTFLAISMEDSAKQIMLLARQR